MGRRFWGEERAFHVWSSVTWCDVIGRRGDQGVGGSSSKKLEKQVRSWMALWCLNFRWGTIEGF